jgi:CDP-paratose 2-epimerase
MSIALITGSAGLIGAESARFFSDKGLTIVGIDNDMRRYFFGDDASTRWSREFLQKCLRNYRHIDSDIRDESAIQKLFSTYGRDIALVIHAAAQPSHDWASRDPVLDFTVNAGGTLTLLQATRQHCPDAPFIFCSTNKVYGDTPNRLPLVEQGRRWEIVPEHPFGIHPSSFPSSFSHNAWFKKARAGHFRP